MKTAAFLTALAVALPAAAQPVPPQAHRLDRQSAGAEFVVVICGEIMTTSFEAMGYGNGRMFLQGFDYLYDAAGGYVGYAWAAWTSPACGSAATGR